MQVQTESGERSDLVTNRQLRDIALNGRNIADLMKLVPGVIAGGTITTSTVTNVVGGFNINGTRALQHEYTVDGVTNLNLGNNTGGLVSVNPDALEEVKVLTSNYQAEYGRAGGGFIALTTRGGTSEYRGRPSLFRAQREPERQHLLQQRPRRSGRRFPEAALSVQLLRVGSGRPVPYVGPKANPKMFFFAAQEYYDQLVPQTASVNIRVPTELERAGNFSQSVDGTGRRDHDRRSADRPAVSRQHHSRRPDLRARARDRSGSCRRPTPPPAATSTTTPRSSPASIRAARTSCAWTGRSRTTRA